MQQPGGDANRPDHSLVYRDVGSVSIRFVARRPFTIAAVVALLIVSMAAPVGAQTRRVALEGGVGHAAFLDDGAIHHSTWAVAAWWGLSPRVWIGPEVVYMIGPGNDRDLLATASVRLHIRPQGVAPYVVAGGGFFRHRDRFVTGSFSHTEGGFTLGAGVRVPFDNVWYVALEVRGGWEPHAGAGVRLGREWR
jgi:hypothetical protein